MQFLIRPYHRCTKCTKHLCCEAVVRWAQQNEYGIETLGISRNNHARRQHFVIRLASEKPEVKGAPHGREGAGAWT